MSLQFEILKSLDDSIAMSAICKKCKFHLLLRELHRHRLFAKNKTVFCLINIFVQVLTLLYWMESVIAKE